MDSKFEKEASLMGFDEFPDDFALETYMGSQPHEA